MHELPLTIVCYRLEPNRGIERATIALAHALAREMSVEVLVLRGDCPDSEAFTIKSGFGARLTLIRRLADASRTIIVSGVWAAAVSRLCGVHRCRLIIWEHSMSPGRLVRSASVRRSFHIAESLYRRADQLIAVSEVVSGELRTIPGHAPVQVIPNLLTDSFDHDRTATPDARLVVAVGGLVPEKQMTILPDVLAGLDEDVEMLILGDGPDRAAIESRASRLGVSHRLRLPGFVADVAPYLAKAGVFISTSESETFGLAVLESGVARVPVVAVDIPALRELIPEFVPGVLVDRSPEALSRAVEAALMGAIDVSDEATAQRRRSRFSVGAITASWVSAIDGESGVCADTG
ncbi:MAG: glycosyltransferase [Actinomycetia bacterium]|nr:glycosyltransferase [Actinomycetes bacterium]MCP4959175.1 glycosyltransferase [Actinomycetes bacterium]